MLYFLWFHAYINVHVGIHVLEHAWLHDWVRKQRNMKINNPLWSVVIRELNKMGKLRCMWRRIYQTVDRQEINWLLSRNCVTFLHYIFIFLVDMLLCFFEQLVIMQCLSRSTKLMQIYRNKLYHYWCPQILI